MTCRSELDDCMVFWIGEMLRVHVCLSWSSCDGLSGPSPLCGVKQRKSLLEMRG